jgi:hypothetical protein
MRSKLADLPRRAWALFRRGGTGGALVRTVSCAEDQTDFELLDERGDHLGTIKTIPSAPSFGNGAPTYLITRLLRRAYDLGTHVRDRPIANGESIPISEDQET